MHQHDRDLVEVALRQKVVLCSPSTLFSVLAVIRQAVEQTQLQRTSDEILVCLAAFETQWGKFADALDKVGRSLDTVRRSWDDLSGTRRRQLERHLDRVGELRNRREAGPGGVGAEGADEPAGVPAAGPPVPVRGVEPGSRQPAGGPFQLTVDAVDAVETTATTPAGLGDAEAQRRATGDVRPLPRPPASAAG